MFPVIVVRYVVVGLVVVDFFAPEAVILLIEVVVMVTVE